MSSSGAPLGRADACRAVPAAPADGQHQLPKHHQDLTSRTADERPRAESSRPGPSSRAFVSPCVELAGEGGSQQPAEHASHMVACCPALCAHNALAVEADCTTRQCPASAQHTSQGCLSSQLSLPIEGSQGNPPVVAANGCRVGHVANGLLPPRLLLLPPCSRAREMPRARRPGACSDHNSHHIHPSNNQPGFPRPSACLLRPAALGGREARRHTNRETAAHCTEQQMASPAAADNISKYTGISSQTPTHVQVCPEAYVGARLTSAARSASSHAGGDHQDETKCLFSPAAHCGPAMSFTGNDQAPAHANHGASVARHAQHMHAGRIINSSSCVADAEPEQGVTAARDPASDVSAAGQGQGGASGPAAEGSRKDMPLLRPLGHFACAPQESAMGSRHKTLPTEVFRSRHVQPLGRCACGLDQMSSVAIISQEHAAAAAAAESGSEATDARFSTPVQVTKTFEQHVYTENGPMCTPGSAVDCPPCAKSAKRLNWVAALPAETQIECNQLAASSERSAFHHTLKTALEPPWRIPQWTALHGAFLGAAGEFPRHAPARGQSLKSAAVQPPGINHDVQDSLGSSIAGSSKPEASVFLQHTPLQGTGGNAAFPSPALAPNPAASLEHTEACADCGLGVLSEAYIAEAHGGYRALGEQSTCRRKAEERGWTLLRAACDHNDVSTVPAAWRCICGHAQPSTAAAAAGPQHSEASPLDPPQLPAVAAASPAAETAASKPAKNVPVLSDKVVCACGSQLQCSVSSKRGDCERLLSALQLASPCRKVQAALLNAAELGHMQLQRLLCQVCEHGTAVELFCVLQHVFHRQEAGTLRSPVEVSSAVMSSLQLHSAECLVLLISAWRSCETDSPRSSSPAFHVSISAPEMCTLCSKLLLQHSQTAIACAAIALANCRLGSGSRTNTDGTCPSTDCTLNQPEMGLDILQIPSRVPSPRLASIGQAECSHPASARHRVRRDAGELHHIRDLPHGDVQDGENAHLCCLSLADIVQILGANGAGKSLGHHAARAVLSVGAGIVASNEQLRDSSALELDDLGISASWHGLVQLLWIRAGFSALEVCYAMLPLASQQLKIVLLNTFGCDCSTPVLLRMIGFPYQDTIGAASSASNLRRMSLEQQQLLVHCLGGACRQLDYRKRHDLLCAITTAVDSGKAKLLPEHFWPSRSYDACEVHALRSLLSALWKPRRQHLTLEQGGSPQRGLTAFTSQRRAKVVCAVTSEVWLRRGPAVLARHAEHNTPAPGVEVTADEQLLPSEHTEDVSDVNPSQVSLGQISVPITPLRTSVTSSRVQLSLDEPQPCTPQDASVYTPCPTQTAATPTDAGNRTPGVRTPGGQNREQGGQRDAGARGGGSVARSTQEMQSAQQTPQCNATGSDGLGDSVQSGGTQAPVYPPSAARRGHTWSTADGTLAAGNADGSSRQHHEAHDRVRIGGYKRSERGGGISSDDWSGMMCQPHTAGIPRSQTWTGVSLLGMADGRSSSCGAPSTSVEMLRGVEGGRPRKLQARAGDHGDTVLRRAVVPGGEQEQLGSGGPPGGAPGGSITSGDGVTGGGSAVPPDSYAPPAVRRCQRSLDTLPDMPSMHVFARRAVSEDQGVEGGVPHLPPVRIPKSRGRQS